jgi:hypothetical protein
MATRVTTMFVMEVMTVMVSASASLKPTCCHSAEL